MSRIDIDDVQIDFEERERNEARYYDARKHIDVCFVCGRGLTEKAVDSGWMVHLVDGGAAIAPVTEPEAQDGSDMGWFPVGSGCANAIPETHRQRGGA